MEDSFQAIDQASSTRNPRSHLLKRAPHLRDNSQMSSPPGFGSLGTRQVVKTQLMTPGSATSASSFEEGASCDGFSETGTPASDAKSITTASTRLLKQPTRRLSSSSREALARRLEDKEQEHDNELLRNLVIKRVPSLDVESEASALSVPLSPRSTKSMRRVIASPRKTARRLVVRNVEASGPDDDDSARQGALQSAHFFNAEEETDDTTSLSSRQMTATRYASTPSKTLRRVVVRRTGADGQVWEEIQLHDADGMIVNDAQGPWNGASSPVQSTPTTTRHIVTPGKLTRRVLRRTGVDGRVYRHVEYLDGDGNIVRTEGEGYNDSIEGAGPTRRIVTPSKTTKRLVIRKLGADGQVHEEVQYLSADGNVVHSEESAFVTRTQRAPSSVSSDSNGLELEGKNEGLVSAASFSDSCCSVTSNTSTGTTSRRVVTRRVVTSPDREPVARHRGGPKSGSSCDAECEEEVQSQDGEFAASGSSHTVVTSQDGSGRRMTSRRIVTPQHVVRRMVIRKGIAASGLEGDSDEVETDSELAQCQDHGNSDDSMGDSSRVGHFVADLVVVPGRARQVTSRTKCPSDKRQRKVDGVATVTDVTEREKRETHDISTHDDVNEGFVSSHDGVSGIEEVDDDNRMAFDVSSSVALVEDAVVVSAGADGSKRSHDKVETCAASAEEKTLRDDCYEFVESNEKPKQGIDNVEAVPLDFVQTKESEATGDAASADTAPVSSNAANRTSIAVHKVCQEVSASRAHGGPISSVDTASAKVVEVHAAVESIVSPSSSRDSDFIASADAAEENGTTTATIETSAASFETTDTSAAVEVLHATLASTDEHTSPSNAPQQKAGRDAGKFCASNSSCRGDEIPDQREDAVAHGTGRNDALFSPVARGHDALVESLRTCGDASFSGNNEEELESKRIHHDATAMAVDTATVAHVGVTSESQQPEEHENVKRSECQEVNPEQSGHLLKEVQSEQLAAAIVSVGSSKRVDWVLESEDGNKTLDVTPSDAQAVQVARVESIRQSISSPKTRTNAAGPVGSSGKTQESEYRTTQLLDSVEPDLELDGHYVQLASPRCGQALGDDEVGAVKPCSLTWNKLCLKRKSWKSTMMRGTASETHEAVLNDVSGSVKAGEFLVITSPSKEERLALLSCLAGHEDAMEGNVTVNGRTWNENMNRYISYVRREDLFYETLTVQEHLIAQAHLGMRRTHTDERCLERVERVIDDMGLGDCRDKLIGGGVCLRGITRGERKLLALATAILTAPSILFVEEPLDGLDTSSAAKIVTKLRWLALEKGLTVLVTLRHPSSLLYELFDVLYLITDASCVYNGKASDCVAYFATIGYQCSEYTSPMDHFMLQMVVGDADVDQEGRTRVNALKTEWTQRHAAVDADNATSRAIAASDDVVANEYDEKNRYYPMKCSGQLWLLWARHVRRLSRYGFVFKWHFITALLLGVVFGLVFLQLDVNDQHGVPNFVGAFFYVVVVQMLFMSYRTFVFLPLDTAIALREGQEYRGGSANLLCWYLTTIASELPSLFLLSIALFAPVYVLIGVGYGFQVYVSMQIVMVLAGWAAVGLAFVTLGLVRHATRALVLYSILLALFVLFGGLLINVNDIPDWLLGLHYVSPIAYSFEAMMQIFWQRVDTIKCDQTTQGCVAFTGNGVLTYYSMDTGSALDASLLLLAVCGAFFFVAFCFLVVLATKRTRGLQWRYDWSLKGPFGRHHQRVANATIDNTKGATTKSVQRVFEQRSRRCSFDAAERSALVTGESHYIGIETPRVDGQAVCDAPSVTLSWRNLRVKAPIATKSKSESDTEVVLSDTSGLAKCGGLVLITGPSSLSNVALLESLGGLDKTVEGSIMLNGVVAAPYTLAQHAAYVPRETLFYETLTVEEHLRFQAQLVLGKSKCSFSCRAESDEMATERVEMVLDEVELTSKRHVLLWYLSEADTKLLAIATALLTNPSLLLAEEPTCGMDFYAAQRVMLKVRQLARAGRTVVVTMDHPSSPVYALFDTLHLLVHGAAVYHGKVSDAVSYFSSLGYPCPQYMNPIEYFQVALPSKANETTMTNVETPLFEEIWSTHALNVCHKDKMESQQAKPQEGAPLRLRLGCCHQLALLFRLHSLRLYRFHVVFMWHSLWMIGASVVYGLIFRQLALKEQQDISTWAGALFFLLVLQMLVTAYRTFVFVPHEMAIVQREHHRGRRYLMNWYLTKVVVELPGMLLLSVLLFVPAYLIIGIGHSFHLYVCMQVVMWLASWSAVSLVSLLVGLLRRVYVALLVYLLLLVVFVACGGLLITFDDMPVSLLYLQYLSPVKYGYEALMKLFWSRITFLACGESHGSASERPSDDVGCIARSGNDVLAHYSMNTSRTSRDDSLILLALTLVCFLLGYVVHMWRFSRQSHKRSTR